MKRTIEINDTLEENVETACEEVKTELENYLDENKPSSCPDLNDLDYSGAIHEIVDSSVPIYTKEIEDTWYLYSNELERAYNDAGIGNNPRENDGMSAIYFYIQQEVNNWFHDNAESIYDEFVESGRLDYSIGDVVFWNDPDQGLYSCNATVTEFIEGKVILDNGKIEALASELEAEHED